MHRCFTPVFTFRDEEAEGHPWAVQLGPGRSDSKDQIWFLCPGVIEVIKVERPEYRGQGLLETGRQILSQKQTCEPRKQGLSCARSLAARGNTQFHKWRLSRGPTAPRSRPLPAQPQLGPRTPDPRFGAQAAARRETAVGRHGCPLPLRLPFMLRSSCSRRGPR